MSYTHTFYRLALCAMPMEYSVNIGRTIKNNGLWVILPLIFIIVLLFIDEDITQKDMTYMFFLFVVLFSFFSAVPLMIHMNFWSLDRYLGLALKESHLTIRNKRTGFILQIEYDDIEQVEITTCSSSRAFWGMNEYLKITLKNSSYVHLTNYLIEPLELRVKLESLVKFSTREEFIPQVADHELGSEDKALRTATAIKHQL
jgi:hypothetical protein